MFCKRSLIREEDRHPVDNVRNLELLFGPPHHSPFSQTVSEPPIEKEFRPEEVLGATCGIAPGKSAPALGPFPTLLLRGEAKDVHPHTPFLCVHSNCLFAVYAQPLLAQIFLVPAHFNRKVA